MPTLTATHRRIAEAILAEPAAVAASTIGELAERCGTSLTTITRFCRELGLSGYPELRLALAAELGRNDAAPREQGLIAFSPDDPSSLVLRSLLASDMRAMEETAAQLDLEAVDRAVTHLVGARFIDFFAVAGSAGVAMDLHLRLHAIGRPCALWSDVHNAICSANARDERDVAVGISHSGTTAEVVEPLTIAKERGATTIAITNFPRSPLAETADIVLTTAAQDTPFRAGGVAARHTQMLVLDCLYIGVVQRTHETSDQLLTAATGAVAQHRLSPR
ncbi:Sialic acid utilization regulator, RpiR family [[Actinomadura] parvosata subsp. kistnae]|uniref:RpiR family transcriptional regulator n=1 Tax=[Actinomadura] parvosata subsp. kistnae TaxID=1909395 RepID=A0A1V0A1C5_9ACTN|nr:MurR/RpiR family transcriptional regulator [Nonomuraea sp. ATCC 55076]AQZ63993.1 RpiR family transcriptional regulator [Nonomuraea sp. ATCC 55076]SPL89865.1 Sialic acid utilization regulator, RpiR family [Actinomadura parvosata subsp. kistnae]